jgi:ABC-type multidrug transport system fused ATPase/permease subunit
LHFPKLVGSVIEAIEGKSGFTINQITLLLFLVLLCQAIFSFFRIYLFSKVSEKAVNNIRLDVFSKIITLPVPFLEEHRVGELTSRITSDVFAIAGLAVIYPGRAFPAGRHADRRDVHFVLHFLETHAFHARDGAGIRRSFGCFLAVIRAGSRARHKINSQQRMWWWKKRCNP